MKNSEKTDEINNDAASTRIDFKTEKKIRNKKKRKILFLIVALLCVAFFLVWFLLFDGKDELMSKFEFFKESQVAPKTIDVSYVPEGDCRVTAVNDTVIICDDKGVTGVTSQGLWKWNVPIMFDDPCFTFNTSYVLITDTEGTMLYAFNEDGMMWQEAFSEGIIGVTPTKDSKFMVLHNSYLYKSAVTAFNYSSEVKGLFERKYGEYYMISGAVSKSGEQVAVSGLYSDSGVVTGVVTFLQASDGEVYSTEMFEDEFYPLTWYLEDAFFAANTDSLVKIIKKTETSDEGDSVTKIWSREGSSTSLLCAASLNDKYLIAAFSESNAETEEQTPCYINIYKNNGSVKKTIKVDGLIRGIKASGKTIVVYLENEVRLYNILGQYIGSFNAVSDIQNVEFLKERLIVISGISGISIADFRK